MMLKPKLNVLLKIFFFTALFFVTMNVAPAILAADDPGQGGGWRVADSTYSGPMLSFQSLLRTLHGILLPVGIGLIAIPLIIINGYKIMTSQGDPAKVNSGKEGLTSAIIGALFILLSLWIMRVVIGNFLQ